jgi:putative FmdB family regulatory protein
LPIFEFDCKSCRLVQEILLSRWDDPDPACQECGGETRRLLPKINVVFTGVISSTKYHSDRDTRPCMDGHFAWRVKSTRNPDGSPEQVRVTTFDEQRAFCEAESLVNPKELGSEPPRNRNKQPRATPERGVEVRVPDERELQKLRSQVA